MTAKMLVANGKSIRNPSLIKISDIDYLRIPATIAKTGDLGGYYYDKEIMIANSHLWNGVPITMGHVYDNNNIPLPLKEKTELHKGYITNSIFNFDTEVWNCDLLLNSENFSEEELEFLKTNPVDVSTGMFVKYQELNGQNVVNQLIPDHLAILIDQKGNCSLEDGCGTLKVNSENSIGKKFAKFIDRIKSKIFSVNVSVEESLNTISFEEIRNRLSSTINDNSDDWIYVSDIYPDFFVYQDGNEYIKNSYKIEDGEVKIEDDSTKVRRLINYVPIENEEEHMAANGVGECGCKKSTNEEIETIVANSIDKLLKPTLDKISDFVTNATKSELNEMREKASKVLGLKPEDLSEFTANQCRVILSKVDQTSGNLGTDFSANGSNSQDVKQESRSNTPVLTRKDK